MSRLLRTDGFLTIYLSLLITALLSLFLALLWSARAGAVRMRTECATDIAMNSVLAEYHRELFEQYDLLMTDLSYGTDRPSICNAEEHLRYYMQGNLAQSLSGRVLHTADLTGLHCAFVKIPSYSLAADGRGAVLRRQILAYMKAEPVEAAFADVLKNVRLLQSRGFDTRDIEAEAAENRRRLESIPLPTREDDEGREETVALDNPADAVERQKGLGILTLTLPDPSAVSRTAIHPAAYVSHRTRLTGTGPDEAERLSEADILLLDQYMFEKCGRYGAVLEKSLLKYQLEYLCAGKESDRKNLEAVAKTLMFWREASNFTCLINDASKVRAAEAAAFVLSAVLLEPELKTPVKYSILFAWSFAESISDLQILYRGGRVPLVKTSDDWRLGLEHLIDFRSHMSRDSGWGLCYDDYLRILLYTTQLYTKTDRLMDLMEMDIRQTPGNAHFRIDGCLDCLSCDIEVYSRIGYSCRIQVSYGYTF